jgi:hypothetical protein
LPEAAWQPMRAAGEAGLAALGALLGQLAAARGVALRV